MSNLQIIKPPFPTGKVGSYVSSTRTENPIRITYLIDKEKTNVLFGEVSFLPGAEGPPGHIHGGCQAAVLDELMGSCCWANKHPVVAKKIEIEFDKMMPLQLTYKLLANIEKIEGRKVYVNAQILIDQTIYAKGSGLFIILDEQKLKDLKNLIEK